MTQTTTTRTIQSVSPQTKVVLGTFPCATADDVTAAVEKARATFQSNRLDLETRVSRILKLRKLIVEDADNIAALISKEVGKPITECFSAEISGVLDTCVWLAQEAEALLAPTRIKLSNPLARSKKCYLHYEPLGVIGIISPWNFPFSIPLSTILHAIVAGNTVVLKPSEKSTLVALKIKQLIENAGFPDGTVNIVVGDGMTGKFLSESPHLSRLVLTGSVNAGKKIMAQTAANLTPLTLELGGKDAAIVLPDAPVEFTARGLVWGAMMNAGQACASIERVYIVRGPQTQDMIDAIVKNIRTLVVGPPEDSKVDVGPLIDQMQLDKVRAQVEEAKKQGASALLGGRVMEHLDGFFYEPTLLINVNHDMAVMREETFGPVLPLMVVNSVEEAVRLANDSNFGLTASIWTQDVARGNALAPTLQVGTVYVNDCIFSHAAPQLPWGGVKQSGIGRSHSHIGLMDMVNIKNVNLDTARGGGRLWWYPYGAGQIRTMRGGIQLLHGSFPWGRVKGLVNFISGMIFGK